MKTTIKTVSGDIIFIHSNDKYSIKEAVREAVRIGADLRNADLQGADLQNADLWGADLWGADLRNANLRNADLRKADLLGADLQNVNLDYSCLPLWCGGQFKADKKICQQILAHALRICELSNCGTDKMKSEIADYIKGWHRESEF